MLSLTKIYAKNENSIWKFPSEIFHTTTIIRDNMLKASHKCSNSRVQQVWMYPGHYLRIESFICERLEGTRSMHPWYQISLKQKSVGVEYGDWGEHENPQFVSMSLSYPEVCIRKSLTEQAMWLDAASCMNFFHKRSIT